MTAVRYGNWAGQSPVTEPGAAAKAIDELPRDIESLCQASSQLVFHYRAGGNFAAKGVPAERVSEIDTRYADAMLGHVLRRGEPTLARARPAPDRVVGCCRDTTVLLLTLARHKGIPARARVGFAAYFDRDWLIDHVVAEIWDEREGRWRLIDGEQDGNWRREVNGQPVNWRDLTDEQFITGPRAWQAARAGTADPSRFVVVPGLDVPSLHSWPYIAHNAIHDLAALNKTEMILWDAWGMQLGHHDPGGIPDEDAAVLDEVCAVTIDPGCDPDVLAGLGARDGLRVPPVVTSFDPMGGPQRQVDVSRTLGR